MVSFNPLHHLWPRVPPSTAPTLQSIATFDGISDDNTDIQQAVEDPQQQRNDATAIEIDLMSPTHRLCQAMPDEHVRQINTSPQHREPHKQFAVSQDAVGRDYNLNSSETGQTLGNGGQYEDSARQMTAQSLDASERHLRTTNLAHHFHTPGVSATASVEGQVKQNSAASEHDDDDLFAEFTNEGYHDNDAGTSKVAQQASYTAGNPATQALYDVSSIKPEPETDAQLPIDTTEPAEPARSTIAVTEDAATAPVPTATQPDTSVANRQASIKLELGLNTPNTPPSVRDERGATSHVSTSPQGSSPADMAHSSGTEYPAEQYAQDPHSMCISPQATLNIDNGQRSPSVDSVITSNRLGSGKAAFSSGGMNLDANSHFLAQQWSQRQRLVDMSTLTAEAVQMNPVLLHGPVPTRLQQGQNAPTLTTSALNRPQVASYTPYEIMPSYAQHMDGPQGSSNYSYIGHRQYPTCPPTNQVGQIHPQLKPPGSAFNESMPHETPKSYGSPQGYSTSALNYPPPPTGVREEEGSETSDDDEPLITRAPRHGSVTTSPTSVLPRARSTTMLNAPENASSNHVPSPKQDSVIELSDDDEGEATEPISWKLPAFEATYHPPSSANETPTAKISIPSLVREEVALTEDHAAQEMHLFVSVFLPAQRALQNPDPQPAHAVLNFHTIAVMVLEAFEQYEIGDELGRGYGFHSGEFARRPSPRASDDDDKEPERTRAAQDADVDDIFFAVIDRWRAAMLAGKQTAKLVRGAQEFCDVALDVIHHVKEHGLLRREPRSKRRVRSDKGVARGPRGGGTKEAEDKGKPAKRKADRVANELQPRKKTKGAPKKAGPKTGKGNAGGGVVVKQRKK